MMFDNDTRNYADCEDVGWEPEAEDYMEEEELDECTCTNPVVKFDTFAQSYVCTYCFGVYFE